MKKTFLLKTCESFLHLIVEGSMPETIADALFRSTHELSEAEDGLYEFLNKILSPKQFESYDHATWDWYDLSLEFKGASNDFDLTFEQRNEIWKAGFSRCWICYTDPTCKEIYYCEKV